MSTPAADPGNPLPALTARLRPHVREWQRGASRFRQSPLAVAGAALVLLYVLVALLAPVIAPLAPGQADPYQMRFNFAEDLQPPSDAHPFGTGESGIDILYGVVWGARISMAMGLGITAVGAVVGTVLGAVAGYRGGRLDELVMRVTDVFLALPVLIIAMSVVVALGPGLWNIAVALTIVWWPNYTRLVRAQVLALREQPYVEAARAVGVSDTRIIFRHILPNALSPVLVQATMDVGTVVLASAALSYIGFGPHGSNFAEWGTLVNKGQAHMMGAPWAVTFPGLAIFGFVLAFNLLGDGLRDLLDPRLRR